MILALFQYESVALKRGQEILASDWYACYGAIVGEKPFKAKVGEEGRQLAHFISKSCDTIGPIGCWRIKSNAVPMSKLIAMPVLRPLIRT